MPELSNLELIYSHLPARMARDDGGLFLKRLLSGVGSELDEIDRKYETFHELINPTTAPAPFIDWWLYALFDWGWFPEWFTLDQQRAFYADIAQHYARRGTADGIKQFLEAFGLRVIVETGAQYWEESVWDEDIWSIDGPLGIVIRVFPEAPALGEDLEYFDEMFFEEAFPVEQVNAIQTVDLDKLIRFCWPLGQMIYVEDLQFTRQLTGIPPEYGVAEYGRTVAG